MKEYDPRLRTHSNTARWDQLGFMAEAMHAEGLSNREIARLLHVSERTVKLRRSRVREERWRLQAVVDPEIAT